MLSIHIVMTCALCHRIKDERWDGGTGGEWCDLTTYLKRYQAQANDLLMSEMFCPDCTLSYNRLMEYGGGAQRDI